eukprot:11247922-Alexandrium_andersonii.AAC.1
MTSRGRAPYGWPGPVATVAAPQAWRTCSLRRRCAVLRACSMLMGRMSSYCRRGPTAQSPSGPDPGRPQFLGRRSPATDRLPRRPMRGGASNGARLAGATRPVYA